MLQDIIDGPDKSKGRQFIMTSFPANYHTHTWRCHHAIGTEREFIESAIKGGLKILGFADHSPMPFPKGVQSFRMDMDQLEDYCATILALKDEYRDDIEIHIGLEVEYYPVFFRRLMDFCKDYPIEYFILGQHYRGNEMFDKYYNRRTDDRSMVTDYVNQTIAGLDQGCFLYLAHPDLINYVDDTDPFYLSEMRRLCVRAKELNVPLEINLLGILDGRHYPHDSFWAIASEIGNEVVFGSDAHYAQNIAVPWVLDKAQAIVDKYHLTRLETLELPEHV